MKCYDELTITDDFFFCKIMSEPTLCKQMIEVLLNIEVDHIENINNQHSIAPSYDSRSIRLDVYVKNSDKVFDIEMQTTNKYNLEKRSRYYQSVLDLDDLSKNMDYKKLKESYIVFICTYDPFLQGILQYTVEQSFLEKPGVRYDDNTHKVFYNLLSDELEKDNTPRGRFLRYLKNNVPTDDFTQNIHDSLKRFKINANWRKEYMTVGMLIDEEKEKAKKEGIAQGIAQGHKAGLKEGITQGHKTGLKEGITQGITQGLAQGKIEAAIIAIKEFNLPIEQVAIKYDIPIEELKKQMTL